MMDITQLQTTLQQTEDLLRRVQRQVSSCRRAIKKPHQISRSYQTQCRVLLCRQHGNHEWLLPYLEVKTKGRDQTCLEEWVQQVRSWYADATAETRKEHEQGIKTAMLRTAASVVSKYMREKKLIDWVEVQNDELGIAPAPTLVANQLQDFGLDGTSTVGPGRVHKHSLQFLSRWRKRWKVGLTKNRPMDACTPEEVKDKAGSQAIRKPDWIQHFFRHVIRAWKKKGSTIWTLFWGRLYKFLIRWGQTTAPIFSQFPRIREIFARSNRFGSGAISCIVWSRRASRFWSAILTKPLSPCTKNLVEVCLRQAPNERQLVPPLVFTEDAQKHLQGQLLHMLQSCVRMKVLRKRYLRFYWCGTACARKPNMRRSGVSCQIM